MKRKPINCITPRTDAEWAPDHPLRKYASAGVMTKTALAKFKVEEIALVCGKPGGKRSPCPPDDSDVACRLLQVWVRPSPPRQLQPCLASGLLQVLGGDAMKRSERLEKEYVYLCESLRGIICERCGATFQTMNEVCSADLLDPCPGFMAIEEAKKKFNAEWDRTHR